MIGGPWPERIGCEGRVVDDELDPRIYPLKGRAGNEVVILLDDDPLSHEPKGEFSTTAEQDAAWSCVIGRKDVVELDPVRDPHDESDDGDDDEDCPEHAPSVPAGPSS